MRAAPLVLVIACANENDVRNTLEAQGFTDIQIGGPTVYKCSENDTTSRTFTAKGANNKKVSGAVCCEWPKACIIRYD